jgi:hypothetical protein
MLSQIYRKIKQILRFFTEKPSASINRMWVRNNTNESDSSTAGLDVSPNSSQMYIPYQLNYFFQPSKPLSSQNNQSYNLETLIYLSNCLAKAYYPDTTKVSTVQQDKEAD